MKEQIQQLISEGRTEDALALLAQQTNDALLLQARYNGGKKQYNMGLIDFTEWSRVQAQINYAALEMAESANKSTAAHTPAPPNPAGGGQPSVSAPSANNAKKVFISYNHRDKEMADRVKDYLVQHGIEVSIDREKMEAGHSISDFIKSNIRSNGYILSMVSEHSLKSGWVGMESTASLFAEWIADKHFIPVALDDKWSSNEFYIDALRYINDTVKLKEKEMREVKKLGGRTTHMEVQKERLLDLKANLSQILDKLHSVLTLPISGDNFEANMGVVLAAIQK
jgi:hypothetical protein